MLTLGQQQARKLIVLCNDFHHSKKLKSVDATLKSIKALGYVQLDTISVVNRAHLHVLWSRNHHFKQEHLETLFATKKIFEYWAHAAALLPMEDYRYSIIRKKQITDGEVHWFKRKPEMMAEVKQVIASEGPKKSSDFKHKRQSKSQWWDWKPAKLALEQLYMEGDLMVKNRQAFHKLYDLTDKVLPADVVTSVPTTGEFCRHLIYRYLDSQGLGNAENIAYLRKGLKPEVQLHLDEMVSEGGLIKVIVQQQKYYALPKSLSLLNNRLMKQVHILSPFDNLVIQRKRLKELFDYDYQIECYVPASKRKFGYFCLPILYGGEFVGRIDCKAYRKQKVLQINTIYQEKKIKNKEQYQDKLNQSLQKFAEFNQCEELRYN